MTGNANLPAILVAGLLAGAACWAVLYGVLLLFRGHEARVRARVRQFVTDERLDEVSDAQQRRQLRANLFSELDTRFAGRSYSSSLFKNIAADIDRADVHVSVTELLLIQTGLSLGLAVVLWLLLPRFGILLAFLGLLLGMLVVRRYLHYLGTRRIARFENQLPDTLAIVASSVRGGFSLFQALQMISKEAAEPVKTEFQRIIQEVSLGAPFNDALSGLALRVPTEDVDILVTAIKLQSQTGGNLSHLLDTVATTIRERHRVQREIKSLTAQQRVSATILSMLPVVLGAVMYVISPAYVSRLFTWGWVLCMPAGAIILSIVGLFVMRRISSIDV